MARQSAISWTHATFNPWRGCSPVSPACDHCYAEQMSKRNPKVLGVWGDDGTRVVAAEKYWLEPLKWNRAAHDHQQWCATHSVEDAYRPRVFCASLADVFEDWGQHIAGHQLVLNHRGQPQWIDHVSGEYATAGEFKRLDTHNAILRYLTLNDVRARLFALIDATPNLDWLLLTKRPENIARMWPDCAPCNSRLTCRRGDSVVCEDSECDRELGVARMRNNVWLGCTVENQEQADKRVPELLKCRDLAPVLFLSCEPLLGPVDLDYPLSLFPDGPQVCCSGFECGCMGLPCDPPAWLNKSFGGVDWVITGGESGPNARPSDPRWFRSLRDQCASAGVAYHHKQNGEWLYDDQQALSSEYPDIVADGANGRPANGWPADRCFEWPDGSMSYRAGVANSGRLLDGKLHDDFPKVESCQH